MAWALASGIEGADVENKERKYQKEQARIDLELLQIKSDAASGKITWEVAQTRNEQWAKNNYSRLQKQAALAAELDQLTPLPADSGRKASPEDSPMPAGTPQAARFQQLEEKEGQALAKIPKQATPEERQRLIDGWSHSKEGADILQEKQQLIAGERQRRAAPPPPAPPPPPPGASPAKLAQANIETRRHALLQEIYAREPNATPERRQILVDQEREKFEALDAESIPVRIQLDEEDIATGIAALQATIADQSPSPTPVPRKK